MNLQELILNGVNNLQGGDGGDLRGALNQMMNTGMAGSGEWKPCIDVVDTPNNLYIYMDIPGVSESSIDVDFFNNKLTISGEKIKKYTAPPIRNEILYGKFTKSITMPISVTSSANVIVNYTNGVLTLIIDKEAESQNRFRVGVNNSQN